MIAQAPMVEVAKVFMMLANLLAGRLMQHHFLSSRRSLACVTVVVALRGIVAQVLNELPIVAVGIVKIGAPSRRVFVRLQVGGISRLDHATLECGDVIDFPPKVIESAHVAVWLSVSTFGYRADGNVEVVVADVAPWATPRIETFVSTYG